MARKITEMSIEERMNWIKLLMSKAAIYSRYMTPFNVDTKWSYMGTNPREYKVNPDYKGLRFMESCGLSEEEFGWAWCLSHNQDDPTGIFDPDYLKI